MIPETEEARVLDTAALDGRQRYQLLTSLVVPRPIAWLSSRSSSGGRNLAPFSYFAALSATPMLVGVSIGTRRGEIKDSLRNVRERGGFCVNFASESQMSEMNESAGDFPAHVDEFERAGLRHAEAATVDAPFVATAPAVLECRLAREVELPGSTSVLIVGEVLRVRLTPEARLREGSHFVESEALRPIARLWGDRYAGLGEIWELARPIL